MVNMSTMPSTPERYVLAMIFKPNEYSHRSKKVVF